MREYLSEVIEQRGCHLVSDMINLIVAPCGTGKTTYIKDKVLPEYEGKTVVFLCDTTMLVEELQHEGLTVLTGQGLLDKPNVYVCTYQRLGTWLAEEDAMKWLRKEDSPSKLLAKIDLLICDEGHNLIKYANMGKQRMAKITDDMGAFTKQILTEYSSGCNYLVENLVKYKNEHNMQIIMLSATPDRISNHYKFKGHVYNVLQGYVPKGYIHHEERYFDNYKSITEIKGKCLVFTPQITRVKKMEEYFKEQGYVVESLWSLNNENKRMTQKQLDFRQDLIREKILGDIDILIVTGAYETGWNLKDTQVDTVIVDSKESDTRVQARGRVRKDISLLYLRKSESEKLANIEIPTEFLDIPLTKESKDDLSNTIKIFDDKGKILKWTRLKKRLEEEGIYNIKDNNIYIEGKKTRISIISKINESVA